jgi:hypothetical protein
VAGCEGDDGLWRWRARFGFCARGRVVVMCRVLLAVVALPRGLDVRCVEGATEDVKGRKDRRVELSSRGY